ncbi:hypothetical protein VTH06DRAFT_7161 [Thermothelomyces fergusii]
MDNDNNHGNDDERPRGGPPCRHRAEALSCANPQCRRREGMLKAEIDRLTAEIQQLEGRERSKAEDVRRLNRDKAALEEANRTLTARLEGAGRRHKRTWPDDLRSYLRNFRPDPRRYGQIYRLCCKEENMSTRKELVHPDLKLVPPRTRHPEDSDSEAGESADSERSGGPEHALEQHGDGIRGGEGASVPFPFEKLPWELQAGILKLLLFKRDQIVHCLSRLDPFVQPDDFPSAEELGPTRSGLMNRFFWGKRRCNLTQDGVEPNRLLAVLGVSRRLHFLGVHIFYGLNTFAFSSLGELGRFCQGSGPARVARIQHVELFLSGSQYLTAGPDTRGRAPFSRRTYPLTWLADMYRLKTLAVHVNETGRSYVRRRHENRAIKEFAAAKTAGQPNSATTRSLRCVQGIDYIYSLRGLDRIRFYDFQKVLNARRAVRVPVRDWSFVEDVTNTTTMPKPPRRAAHAELENLERLLPAGGQNWTPSADDWQLVGGIYINSNNGCCSYDELRARKRNRRGGITSLLSAGGPVPLAEATTSSNSETESTSGDDSSSDADTPHTSSGSSHSESSSDSDSSSHSSSGRTASSLRRRQHRLSDPPMFVSDTEVKTESGTTSSFPPSSSRSPNEPPSAFSSRGDSHRNTGSIESDISGPDDTSDSDSSDSDSNSSGASSESSAATDRYHPSNKIPGQNTHQTKPFPHTAAPGPAPAPAPPPCQRSARRFSQPFRLFRHAPAARRMGRNDASPRHAQPSPSLFGCRDGAGKGVVAGRQ